MIFTPLASSSAGNAYIVDDGETRILLECGIPFRKLQRLSGFSLNGIAGCLLSHEHKDHSRCYLDLLKNGVPIYASAGTADALDCELVSVAEERVVFSIGSFDVLPFATFHDAAEPFGYLIRSRADGEKLMFATDTVNLGYRFPGVNIVALECNYSTDILERAEKLPEKVRRRISNSHMEIGRACTYLSRMDRSVVRQVFLMHLSDACSNERMFAAMARGVCPGIDVIVCPKERTA